MRPNENQLRAAKNVALRKELQHADYAALSDWQRQVQGIDLQGAQALALSILDAELSAIEKAQKAWENNPLPEPTYRQLIKGEISEKGDEYLSFTGCGWYPLGQVGRVFDGIHADRTRTKRPAPANENNKFAPDLLAALKAIKNHANTRYEVEAQLGEEIWEVIAKAEVIE